MNPNSRKLAIHITLWVSRALVCGIFLLWGAFFIEHTSEWFVTPFPHLPPLKVCLFQALHLLLLLGLLASLRWSRVGLIWVTVAACAFFLPIAGVRALAFVGITILPVLLLTGCDWLKRADKPRMRTI